MRRPAPRGPAGLLDSDGTPGKVSTKSPDWTGRFPTARLFVSNQIKNSIIEMKEILHCQR